MKVGPRLPHPRGCTVILSHPLVHLFVSCFSRLSHAVPPLFQRFYPADQFCCLLGYFSISRLAHRHVGSEYLLLYHPCTLSFGQASLSLSLSLSPSLPLFFPIHNDTTLIFCISLLPYNYIQLQIPQFSNYPHLYINRGVRISQSELRQESQVCLDPRPFWDIRNSLVNKRFQSYLTVLNRLWNVFVSVKLR